MGLLALGLGSSCTPDRDLRPMCLPQIDVDGCTPLYPAEFPVIFDQVLRVTCGAGGTNCHDDAGRKGGLAFVTQSEAYAALTGMDGGKIRVVPGDPACSEMMVRLDLVGHEWSMPPAAALDERARCSIRRWIAGGALASPTAAALPADAP